METIARENLGTVPVQTAHGYPVDVAGDELEDLTGGFWLCVTVSAIGSQATSIQELVGYVVAIGAWRRHNRGIVVVVPGSGCSQFIPTLIASLKDKFPVLPIRVIEDRACGETRDSALAGFFRAEGLQWPQSSLTPAIRRCALRAG